MASFFRRLLRIGASEAHSVIDQLEDPVKMAEQGIRELKKDLESAMESFAEIKSLAIREEQDIEKQRTSAQDWEKKAMALLQSSQDGKMEAAEAERLATEALSRKENCIQKKINLESSNQAQQRNVSVLQQQIGTLQSQIKQYENELITLRAKAKTASATKKINKQLSSIDSGSTLAMLERMKEKVDQEESLALAYGEMNSSNPSIEDEIDNALSKNPESSPKNLQLEQLKAKMGIKNEQN